MKKTHHVVITTDISHSRLVILLRDAIGNFRGLRRDPVAYVDKNYNYVWMTPNKRKAKITEVTSRVAAAACMEINSYGSRLSRLEWDADIMGGKVYKDEPPRVYRVDESDRYVHPHSARVLCKLNICKEVEGGIIVLDHEALRSIADI